MKILKIKKNINFENINRFDYSILNLESAAYSSVDGNWHSNSIFIYYGWTRKFQKSISRNWTLFCYINGGWSLAWSRLFRTWNKGHFTRKSYNNVPYFLLKLSKIFEKNYIFEYKIHSSTIVFQLPKLGGLFL